MNNLGEHLPVNSDAIYLHFEGQELERCAHAVMFASCIAAAVIFRPRPCVPSVTSRQICSARLPVLACSPVGRGSELGFVDNPAGLNAAALDEC